MDQSASDRREERPALIAGFAAFITWGLVPVYWKLLKTVPATEILAHRFVWTTVFLVTAPELATSVERGARSRALAAHHALLPNEWNFHRNQLVSVYLGG